MARKKPGMWSIVITTVLVLWAFAFLFAAPWLAAWFYETEAPTGDQIKLVKLVLSAPIAVPLLLVFLLNKWEDRRRHRNQVREALYGAKLADPSHELRLDSGRADVD